MNWYIKSAPILGRLTAATALLNLTLLSLDLPTAVAQETSLSRCPETAQVGSKPAGSDAAGKAGDAHGAGTPQGSSGLRVYLDPETGEFSEPPSDALAAEPPAAAFSTSHEGLVETPSPVPGGGVMVDLKGRFRSPLTATVGADGKAKMQHGPCMQTSEEGR